MRSVAAFVQQPSTNYCQLSRQGSTEVSFKIVGTQLLTCSVPSTSFQTLSGVDLSRLVCCVAMVLVSGL